MSTTRVIAIAISCTVASAAPAGAQPGVPSRTTFHAAIGAYVPPAGGLFQGVTPLAGGQVGVRLARQFALTAAGAFAQPRCDPGRCTDAMLAGFDLGVEQGIVNLPPVHANLFVSAGAGTRWYRVTSAGTLREWVPAGFLGFGAELRRRRVGVRAEGRMYGSRPPTPPVAGWQRDRIATIALGYHFR